MKRDVFISYSRKNYDAVVAIKRQIDNVTGADCWMDLKAIESGADMFTQDIVAGINDCKVLLFMLSKWSQESEYALDELRFAKKKNKKIVLVNIDGCMMTDIFDFKYGGRDIILWSDTPQREKLFRDIARWIGVKSESKEVQSSSSKIVSQAGSNTEDATFNVNGVSFKMVYVEGGTFMMGATAEQGYYAEMSYRAKPEHKVTLNDYYIGETVVTRALWKSVMGNIPLRCRRLNGGNLPIEYVSWNDAEEFVRNLNAKTGRVFSLPTEAEWEYAARGGRKSKGYKYSGSNNSDEVAWFYENSGKKVHAVKGKKANELGLYDMSGNVWEMCKDRYGRYRSDSQTNPVALTGSSCVCRGGSSWNYASACIVSNRSGSDPDSRDKYTGFRLVLH